MCSSHTACSGFHGAKPRFGSIRCHDCSAQNEPSGAVQPVTNHASFGPVYGLQTLLIVF